MSVFSVSGLSSGIDFASMTSKLIEFERRPIDLMETKQTEFKKQLDTWNQVRTKISEFENTVNSMKTLSDLNPVSGSFSNNNSTDTRNVLSVLSTGLTEEQDYDITIDKVAKNHRIMSGGYSSGETIWSQKFMASALETFSISTSGTTTNFEISSGQNDTLEKLRNSINNADIGVTASVVDDGSSSDNFHLVLTSNSTGTDGSITASDTIAYTLGPFASNFTELQAAQDAEIDFGGLTVTRSSNTINDLIDDTTIQLQNFGSGTISFTQGSSLKDKIIDFVDKYNETKLFISEQINYNAETKVRGELFGDSTLLGTISSFNNIVSDAITGLTGDYDSLASIGITTNKEDGTLTIDSSMLDEAIANDTEGVGNIFAASGASSASTVSFVDNGRDTTSDAYTVYFTGTDGSDNVEGYLEDSSGNTITATGSGRFLTATNGLIVRIDESASSGGSVGTVTYSSGIAEQFSTELYNLNTFDGRFFDKTTYLEDLIEENAEKIQSQIDRLEVRELEYKRRFAQLESFIGAMQGESDFLNGQISNLQKSYIR